MRNAYLETLYDIANNDKNVFAIISDNGAIVYDKYREKLSKQYINAGISEANMVAMAAGMASRGKVPFVYTIGAFLAYRAYEFILNDVCLQKQNVKLVGIGAGCSYSLLGPSHHAIHDFAVLRTLPELTIFSPASPIEVKNIVKAAYEMNSPVYIRLGTNGEPEIYSGEYSFEVGKGIELCKGNDVTIIGTGSILSDVIKGESRLRKEGISVRIINMHTIKPLDREIIIKAARETGAIVSVEEHSIIGGLGSAIAEVLSEEGITVKFKRVAIIDKFIKGYGTHEQVKTINGIGIEDIVSAVRNII